MINEQEVPDSFKKVILEIDKTKIREALESGQSFEWARIGERGTHLRIK